MAKRKNKSVEGQMNLFEHAGMSKGGDVESQMKLFEEGGLADDGMEEEPVTGNEVPPGSMAVEVRDDIDAKLSEGEYVVPADVVRYFGVKFFEDLRNAAKTGMGQMEQDGRIGGEPVSQDGIPMEDEELTDEEEEMLREALAAGQPQMTGMAEGGVVGVNNAIPTSPYSFGGAYGQSPQSQQAGAGAFEPRQYVNSKTGEIRTFQFLNGRSLSYIPEGFVPATKEAIEAAKASTTAQPSTTEGTGMNIGRDPNEEASKNQDPRPETTSEKETGIPSYGLGGRGGTALGAVAGTVLGGNLLTGALGAKSGAQADSFNAARNELVDAILKDDQEAIKGAEDKVRETRAGLTTGAARLGVFGEGADGDEAVRNVYSQVEKYQSEGGGASGSSSSSTRSGGIFGGYTGLKDMVDGGGPGASGWGGGSSRSSSSGGGGGNFSVTNPQTGEKSSYGTREEALSAANEMANDLGTTVEDRTSKR